jgi:hypothetical protein
LCPCLVIHLRGKGEEKGEEGTVYVGPCVCV